LGSEPEGAEVAQYELAEPLEEEVGAAAPWEPTEPLVAVEEAANSRLADSV